MIKKYKGFTLVEMLIVMGILVILMAVGIAVGRFVIRRATIIEHQAAVDEIYRGLLKFKQDNKEYPQIGSCYNCVDEQVLAEILGFKGENYLLENYIEEKPFNGGGDATYYYYVDPSDAQLVIVCVSLGGFDDENLLGYYCNGDGIGYLPYNQPLGNKQIPNETEDPYSVNIIRGFDASDWYKDTGFASDD